MSDIHIRFNNKINRYFGENSMLKNLIEKSSYLDDFLQFDDSIDFDSIIHFINIYEEHIIRSGISDELLKNELLRENYIIYRTKESKITYDYFRKLIENIRNRNFDYETITLLLDIMKLINIYGINTNEVKLKQILDNKVYSTVKNDNLVSDGNLILSTEKRREKSDILLNWCNKCGNLIIDNVFSLDLLLERLLELQKSDITEIIQYKDKIFNLIKYTRLAIDIRDREVTPSSSDISIINSLFESYNEINNELIINAINSGKYSIIHFVQTAEVNFQLVQNDVIDFNESLTTDSSLTKESAFNSEQNTFFINSYIDNAKKDIESKIGVTFDISDPEHRRLLQTYLDYFNSTFNNNPLKRVPMNIHEKGRNFTDYVRPSSNRLSCSFVSNERIKSHLDRKIGLVVRPISPSAIISTSIGYTSNKDFKDFRHDCVSYLDLIKQIYSSKRVNETCLDASQCEVLAVILLDGDENSFIRASKLASFYHVSVINKEKTK